MKELLQFIKKVPFVLIEVRLYQAYKIWTLSLSDIS